VRYYIQFNIFIGDDLNSGQSITLILLETGVAIIWSRRKVL